MSIVGRGVAGTIGLAALCLFWGCVQRERAITVLDSGILSPEATKVVMDAVGVMVERALDEVFDRLEGLLHKYAPEGGGSHDSLTTIIAGIVIYGGNQARKEWRRRKQTKQPPGGPDPADNGG